MHTNCLHQNYLKTRIKYIYSCKYNTVINQGEDIAKRGDKMCIFNNLPLGLVSGPTSMMPSSAATICAPHLLMKTCSSQVSPDRKYKTGHFASLLLGGR